ncbi:MAG: FtsW/RodA/SpoVE family cell cycle protein, partial [Desulfosudaceae bacterium]
MLIREERKKQADWGLLIPVLLVGIIGAVTLYSAAASETEALQRSLFLRQMIWLLGGLLLVFITLVFDHKTLYTWAEGIYLVCVGLLVAVFYVGIEAGGARRWLPLGPVAIQPSEFVKLAIIIILAKHYARHASDGKLTLRQLVRPLLIIAVPFVLIRAQPDLGTAIMMVLVAVSLTGFVGISRRTLVLLIVVTLILMPLIWFFFLHD